MEAAETATAGPKAVAAAPITKVIATRVRALRKEARLSGPALADLLAERGIPWNRTTVAKFETFQRNSITVQELLALALALDVPPIMLLADPREIDAVPAAEGFTVNAWDALLWLTGSGTIDGENSGRTMSSATWLIQAGWTLVEAVADLSRRERYDRHPDEAAAERARQRDDARHRDALRLIGEAAIRIDAAGAPLPPMLPLDHIRQRAQELEVELPRILKD